MVDVEARVELSGGLEDLCKYGAGVSFVNSAKRSNIHTVPEIAACRYSCAGIQSTLGWKLKTSNVSVGITTIVCFPLQLIHKLIRKIEDGVVFDDEWDGGNLSEDQIGGEARRTRLGTKTGRRLKPRAAVRRIVYHCATDVEGVLIVPREHGISDIWNIHPMPF